MKKFSVLLLYPEYCNDDGKETYYAHVVANDRDSAVDAARDEAWNTNDAAEGPIEEADDFIELLVLSGHVEGL